MGLTILIMVLISLTLGMVFVYSNRLKKKVRIPHLWLGRTISALEIIEIFLGLILVRLLTIG
jgi:hypothetical protein